MYCACSWPRRKEEANFCRFSAPPDRSGSDKRIQFNGGKGIAKEPPRAYSHSMIQ